MSFARALALLTLCLPASARSDEKPLVQRPGLHGKEFSEVGRLYLGEDQLIHFRTEDRIYFFSHMYYIWDTLKDAGVVVDGKIQNDGPLRLRGNYSKAASVYEWVVEPALRGSQIVWIDGIEAAKTPKTLATFSSLFDGKTLNAWSQTPSSWSIKNGAIHVAKASLDAPAKILSRSVYGDFELSFEYRASWGVSASLVVRANEGGEGISIGLDHLDGGTVGFPKSATGASKPFRLYESRHPRGVGKTAFEHIQYDGRVSYDPVAQDGFLESCKLSEFLREWDGAYWNIVKVRCTGNSPEVTVFINGFQICRFRANSVRLGEENPKTVGTLGKQTIRPEGRIGFAVHSTGLKDASFSLRELRILELKRKTGDPSPKSDR